MIVSRHVVLDQSADMITVTEQALKEDMEQGRLCHPGIDRVAVFINWALDRINAQQL